VRHQAATVYELSRVAELAGLPAETLARLAERMERRELAPGERLELGGRVGVLVAGMLNRSGGVLKPGELFEGAVSALTPATIVSCDREVFDELAAGGR
jgi:hypothetical protein